MLDPHRDHELAGNLRALFLECLSRMEAGFHRSEQATLAQASRHLRLMLTRLEACVTAEIDLAGAFGPEELQLLEELFGYYRLWRSRQTGSDREMASLRLISECLTLARRVESSLRAECQHRFWQGTTQSHS